MTKRRQFLFRSERPRSPRLGPQWFRADQETRLFLEPSPLWSRFLLWSLSGGAAITTVWACFATYESTSVFSGELQTVRGEYQIKSAEDGFISEVNASPHRFFRRGQTIFALSTLDQRAQIQSVDRRLAIIGRMQNSIESSFRGKQEQLQRRIDLSADLIHRFERLEQSGGIPQIQLLERRAELENALAGLEALEQEKAMNQYTAEMEKNSVETQIDQIKRSLSRVVIAAPADGYLQNAPQRSVGERVQAGEALATFVPVDPLVAQVQVPSRLARPIRTGESVQLGVDAFPSSDFGYLQGRVASISPTSIAPKDSSASGSGYNVQISIDPVVDGDSKIPFDRLKSGMAVQARITLDRRPVITLIFDFLDRLIKPIGESR
jgi:multidrug resistance efflux pump